MHNEPLFANKPFAMNQGPTWPNCMAPEQSVKADKLRFEACSIQARNHTQGSLPWFAINGDGLPSMVMVASNYFFSTSWIWFRRHAELELRIISYCIVFLGIISSIHFIYTPPFINVCERVGLWFQTCFNVPPRIMLETANETCPNSQRSGDNCDFDPTIFWCLWQLGKLGCGQIHGLIGAICISNGQLVESCLKLQWRKWQSTGGLPRTWWELSAASFLYGDCWPAGMSRQETCCGPWVWPGNRGSLKKASSSSAPPQDQFLAFQPWSSSFKRHPTLYPCLLSVRNHFSPVSLGIPIAWFIRVGVVSLLIQKYSVMKGMWDQKRILRVIWNLYSITKQSKWLWFCVLNLPSCEW